MGKRGPWAALSVGFDRDPRIKAVSNDAQLLYVRLLLWTVEHLTDGRFTRAALADCNRGIKNIDQCLDQLCEQRLLLRRGGKGANFTFPPTTWASYQATKADVDAKRAGQRARTAKWRDALQGDGVTRHQQERDAYRDASQAVPPTPTRSVYINNNNYKPRAREDFEPRIVWDYDPNGNLVRIDDQAHADDKRNAGNTRDQA